VGAIKQILKNKPYDQKGAEFNINLLRFRPSLTGYIVIKESYEQIDLKTAECEAAVGNVKGFSFSCVVKSPLDQQKLFLSYIYKYETKLGLFKLKVGSSKMSLLAKNIFTCMPNSKSLLLATFE